VSKFSHNDLIVILTAIGTILILSRIISEMGRRFHFPIVMGEIVVGILLGPTILGTINPDFFERVFPKDGNVSIAFDGLVNLSVVLLLFVAGLEVQLSMVLKQGKAAIYTSFFSMLIPFATGFGAAYYFPQWFGNASESGTDIFFAMFIGHQSLLGKRSAILGKVGSLPQLVRRESQAPCSCGVPLRLLTGQ